MAANLDQLRLSLVSSGPHQRRFMSATLKHEMRNSVLAKRDALAPEWRLEASKGAAIQALRDFTLAPGAIVAGFLPIRSEIDPRPFMLALMEKGARLCVPAILDRENIVFRAWKPEDPLEEMAFKTLGPPASAPELTPDIMLLPLSAFDQAGNRIGYGGGFYDRYLAQLAAQEKRVRVIGMAFGCQEVEAIPVEPHDFPIGEIVTENGLRRLEAGLG